MQALSVSCILLVVAAFIQMAVGLTCYSICAACWKTGSPGVDIKLFCELGDCGSACPSGYDSMHCAKRSRCLCREPDCGDLGPCVCGTEIDMYGRTVCKKAPLGGCP